MNPRGNRVNQFVDASYRTLVLALAGESPYSATKLHVYRFTEHLGELVGE